VEQITSAKVYLLRFFVGRTSRCLLSSRLPPHLPVKRQQHTINPIIGIASANINEIAANAIMGAS
jgi:hypothetical protein